ncbi:hypothetical protein Dimus_016754 [Dionaea muscipula]
MSQFLAKRPRKTLLRPQLNHPFHPQSLHSAGIHGCQQHYFHCSSSFIFPLNRRQGRRGAPRWQGRCFDGSCLPLCRLLHSGPYNYFTHPNREASLVLSHPFPPSVPSPLQEKLLNFSNLGHGFSVSPLPGKCFPLYQQYSHSFHAFPSPSPSPSPRFRVLKQMLFPVLGNSNPMVLIDDGLSVSGSVTHFDCRGFSSFGQEKEIDDDSDVEEECDRRGSGSCMMMEPIGSAGAADPEEVERVCKVIEELFALDRNMEAVLDDSGINLTHDLVVDVLQRFKHARKPALRFFYWAGQRRQGFSHDSTTYNVMMRILGKTRQFETMVSMLDEMGEKTLLTMDTFIIAIQAFSGAKERKKAVGIFELMKKHKFKVGVETINTLLDSLGRDKLGKEAQTLFEKLKGRFTPNLRTYTVLLNGWCRVKNLVEAGRIWNEMIDRGFKPDIIAYNTMLDGLVKAKKRSDSIKLFEVMKSKGPVPNVRTYTILINELCKQGKMTEAGDYFQEMLNSGCEPDAAVYTCMITGFGNQRRMDKVYSLLKEMKSKRARCVPDAKTYNSLIKLLTNRRMPDDAVNVYKKMVGDGIQPTIHTYNMMMKSYFVTGDYEMAREVWGEMARNGCCPDDNSYVVLIGGLIRQGRWEEACRYLEEMMEKGMKVPQLDYNKFAADFSRAGRPNILEELAQKMKFSGKFEASEVFARWAEMMKTRVKRRDPLTVKLAR